MAIQHNAHTERHRRPRRRTTAVLAATVLIAAALLVFADPAEAGDGGTIIITPQGEPGGNLFDFEGGFANGPITVSFSGEGTPCDDWVTSEPGELPCDVPPGRIISAVGNGGASTAAVEVPGMSIDAIQGNDVTVTVESMPAGFTTGCAGTVHLVGPEGQFLRYVPDGGGVLDLSVPGPCPDTFDDVVWEPMPGEEFQLRAFDADADSVRFRFVNQGPQVIRDPARGTVYGEGFAPDIPITVEVMDGECTTTIKSGVETTTDGNGVLRARLGFAMQDCVRISTPSFAIHAFPGPDFGVTVDGTTDQVTIDGEEWMGQSTTEQPYMTAHVWTGLAADGATTDFAFADADGNGFIDGPYVGPVVDTDDTPADFGLGGPTVRVEMYHPFGSWQAIAAATPSPVVDVELNPAETGYWVLTEAGHVAGVGADVPVFDDTNTLVPTGPAAPPAVLEAGERVVSMSITPTGDGYLLFTDRGRVLARGDATHVGDLVGLGITLDQPAVDSVALPDGSGYYIVAGDGGIFAFGGAVFLGSVPQILPGVTLDAPVVGLVPNLAGDGYWLIAADGGIFSFGNVEFHGSIPGVLPGVQLAAPVIGALASGNAYLMFADDGGIFNFGTSVFHGSLGANANPDPISSVDVLADRSGYVLVDRQGVVVGFGSAFPLSSGFISPDG